TQLRVRFFQHRAERVRISTSPRASVLAPRWALPPGGISFGSLEASAPMMINLSGHNRDRFVSELRDHREAFSLSDKEYAEQILKVSPNTFRKCLESSGRSALALKRHTFVSIFTGSGLDPKAYGLSIGVPSQTSPHGGYKTSDYRFLCGRFFLYRRTFLSARHITRTLLEIYTNGATK